MMSVNLRSIIKSDREHLFRGYGNNNPFSAEISLGITNPTTNNNCVVEGQLGLRQERRPAPSVEELEQRKTFEAIDEGESLMAILGMYELVCRIVLQYF